MREFWDAFKRGIPVTRRTILRGLQNLAIVLLIATVISAPFVTSAIDSSWQRGFVWFGFISLALFLGIPVILAPYYGMREMKLDAEAECSNYISQLENLQDLSDYASKQAGDEGQWLHLVNELIDFQRTNVPSNQVVVKYQIDSGLVFNFKPHRMWIKLKIGGYESEEMEEITVDNLLRGKRTQWPTRRITIKDEGILSRMESCRQGAEMEQKLKILIQMRADESPIVLEA